jgi:hypothetical protein
MLCNSVVHTCTMKLKPVVKKAAQTTYLKWYFSIKTEKKFCFFGIFQQGCFLLLPAQCYIKVTELAIGREEK